MLLDVSINGLAVFPSSTQGSLTKLTNLGFLWTAYFHQVKRVISYEQADSSWKPKIFCDSTFMELQTATSEVKDGHGHAIPIDPANSGGEMWKLKDWEESKGRKFGEHLSCLPLTGKTPPKLKLRKSKWRLSFSRDKD